MKRILLFALCAIAFGGLTRVNAQCEVTNLYFNLKNFSSNGTSCTGTFDLGWDQRSNNGSKYSFVHLWLASDYPATHTFGNAAGPLGGTTGILTTSKSFGTLVINTGAISSEVYPNGATPSLVGTLTKTLLADGRTTRYRITNITKTFATCPISDIRDLAVKGVVWAAQDNNGKNIACISTNLNFLPPVANDLTIATTFFCDKANGTKGREYKIDFSSTNPSTQALTVSYNVYVDNGNGEFDPATEQFIRTVNIPSLSATSAYTSGRVGYDPYGSRTPEANRFLWFFVTVRTVAGDTFTRLELLDNGCSLLPVKYSSFSVARNTTDKQQVDINWTTAQEQNNKGFFVQRKTDGDWKDAAFVFSAADRGNSNTALTYKFKDQNNHKGVSQYRLLQVDLDGKGTYSEVKAIGADNAAVASSVQLFPNPGKNGKVNLLFADQAAREILVSDMNGRIVKRYSNHIAGSLQIDGLGAGFYSIKILNKATGLSEVQKLIMQ